MFSGMIFINVIESPSESDLTSGRSEGKMLTAALELAGLPHSYSLVTNYTEFMTALGKWTVAATNEHKRVPVIHLSMHGSPEGVVLTDGKFLPWADLNWKLRMINLNLKDILIVCLSSCYGLSGLRMLKETAYGVLEHQQPFRLLVSNLDPVPWSDAAVAFSTFYHLLERGKNPLEAVTAMRVASGNEGFFGLLTGDTLDDKVIVLGSDQLRKAVAQSPNSSIEQTEPAASRP
jgi:hypothetical protein